VGITEDPTDGRPTAYEGPDMYEPSKWVLEVVGGQYRAPRWDTGPDGVAKDDTVTYTCDGYDPRSGFGMVDPRDG